MNAKLIKLDKPIKETRTCLNCGRKKTFVFDYQLVKPDSNERLGLRTRNNELCMPYMVCPRCKKNTMVEVK